MNTITVKANKRGEIGTKYAKGQRKEQLIPAVLYGGDNNVHLTTTHNEVKAAIYTPNFHLINLDVDGEVSKCIVKDVQFHPVTDAIVHMDFLRLIDGTSVKVDIPIRFKGIAPGVKSGGKLMKQMNKVSVKTMPDQLIGELFADVSELELGQSVRVRDLECPDSIELLTNDATPIGIVEVPRALRSAEAGEEEGADPLAPAAEAEAPAE